MNRILPTLIMIFLAGQSYAQYAYDLSVLLEAKIDKATPSITLSWNKYTPSTNYIIYRKSKAVSTWGSPLVTVPATDTAWTDTNVKIGNAYEYRVVRNGGTYVGNGYIYSGIDLRIEADQGKIIVLVDSTLVKNLEAEINLYLDDLIGEGWLPIVHTVPPSDNISKVKSIIQTVFDADPGNTKAVFLLGHIPVPYSGNLNPDGHPDHQGAWPADSYYGDMNGTWSDNVINNPNGGDPRNHNIPGDGKFDQSYNPSAIELQVGRVDFTNLPAFTDNATELTRKYLIKNHAFRTKQFVPERRGLIQDNFNFSEGFAQTAYKGYSTMFGRDNILIKPYLSTLTAESYLWSYGAGGGNYVSAGGIASSFDFAADSIQSVFTMLFGSYFGDWDSQNNFLRSALASGTVLTDVWAGRPNFQFHHMSLGETIGYGVKLTQNNNNYLYDPGYGAGAVHIALMGDPTLKLYPIKPVEDIVFTDTSDHLHIAWQYPYPVDHFEIYSRSSVDEAFKIAGITSANSFSFIDSCATQNELIEYMVRAVSLDTTSSGTYYNLSKGARKSIVPSGGKVPAVSIDYNIVEKEVTFLANGNANSYMWEFGDGTTSNEQSPIHTYKQSGEYTVILNTSFNCTIKSDTFLIKIILTSDKDQKESLLFNLYPTIANKEINLALSKSVPVEWDIINNIGQSLMKGNTASNIKILVATLTNGMYYLKIKTQDGIITKPFTIQK